MARHRSSRAFASTFTVRTLPRSRIYHGDENTIRTNHLYSYILRTKIRSFSKFAQVRCSEPLFSIKLTYGRYQERHNCHKEDEQRIHNDGRDTTDFRGKPTGQNVPNGKKGK